MFDDKQLDKLQEDGYLYFELNEEDKETLRVVRDKVLTFENIKEITFRYFRRTTPFRNVDDTDWDYKQPYDINISVSPTVSSDWENMLEELNEWCNLQEHTITNFERNLYFFDGRCEVGGSDNPNWDALIPILKNIFNSCYTDNPRNADIKYRWDYKKSYGINGRIMFKDMWLEHHTDGTYGGVRPCTILLYANEDWKPGDGGEFVCDGNVLEPTLGNAAILDFTRDNNVEHGVNPILTDFIRRSWTVFVNKKGHN